MAFNRRHEYFDWPIDLPSIFHAKRPISRNKSLAKSLIVFDVRGKYGNNDLKKEHLSSLDAMYQNDGPKFHLRIKTSHIAINSKQF